MKILSHAQGSRISHMCLSALVSQVFWVSVLSGCVWCALGHLIAMNLTSCISSGCSHEKLSNLLVWGTLTSFTMKMCSCSNICLQKFCSSEQNVRVIVGDTFEWSAENTWWCWRMWKNCRVLYLGKQFCLFCLFACLFCLLTEDTHSSAARNGSVIAFMGGTIG